MAASINQCITSHLFKVQMLSKLRCLFLLVSESGQKALQKENKNKTNLLVADYNKQTTHDQVIVTDDVLCFTLSHSLLQGIFLFQPHQWFSLQMQRHVMQTTGGGELLKVDIRSLCVSFTFCTSCPLHSLRSSRRLWFVWSNTSIFSNNCCCCRSSEAACSFVIRFS